MYTKPAAAHGAGRRTEVARVAGLVIDALENVEQVTFGHAGADFSREFGQSGRLLRRRHMLQVRRSDKQVGFAVIPRQ